MVRSRALAWAFATALAVLVPCSTRAAADPMAVYYDNTMVSHQADGSIHRIYFNRDGTFSIQAPDRVTRGTYVYVAERDEVCLTIGGRTLPCRPAYTDIHVGSEWRDTDPNGTPERQVLEAGRAAP
jgi:hypothetical protein